MTEGDAVPRRVIYVKSCRDCPWLDESRWHNCRRAVVHVSVTRIRKGDIDERCRLEKETGEEGGNDV